MPCRARSPAVRTATRWLVTAVAATACLSGASVAAGEAPPAVCQGDDEVSLKNGGMLRGTVVAVEPGAQVVIVVCGDKRTLPWEQVGKVERGKDKPAPAEGASGGADEAGAAAEAAPPGDTAAPSTSPGAGGLMGVLGALAVPEAPPPPQPGVVRIHVDSDDPDVRLFRFGAPTVARMGNMVSVMPSTELVCQSPCDTIVDGRKGAQFYFAGDGVPMSSFFEIGQRSGDVVAQVDSGIGSLYVVGGVLAGTGGIAAVLGALFTPIGLVTTDASSEQSGFTTAGEVMLAAGGGGIIAGILMIAAAGTDFELVSPDGVAADARGGLGPVWRF